MPMLSGVALFSTLFCIADCIIGETTECTAMQPDKVIAAHATTGQASSLERAFMTGPRKRKVGRRASTRHPVDVQRVFANRRVALPQRRSRIFARLEDRLARLAAHRVAGCAAEIGAEAPLYHVGAELRTDHRIDVFCGVSCRDYEFMTDDAGLGSRVGVDPGKAISSGSRRQRQLQDLRLQRHLGKLQLAIAPDPQLDACACGQASQQLDELLSGLDLATIERHDDVQCSEAGLLGGATWERAADQYALRLRQTERVCR